ncbi:MAG: hypothetical protein AAGM38_17045, partial [Pseudomonadota bacterium]
MRRSCDPRRRSERNRGERPQGLATGRRRWRGLVRSGRAALCGAAVACCGAPLAASPALSPAEG